MIHRMLGIVFAIAMLSPCVALLSPCVHAAENEKLQALLIEGQNNHRAWPTTSQMMKRYLEETDLFEVDVVRTAANGTDPDFAPSFEDYDVVVSNYNGAPWPEATQAAFVDYVQGGGGFVVVHAANNSFGDWQEYNAIIGLGGWGGRSLETGPYLYYNDEGERVVDPSEGRTGGHGRQQPFPLIVRDSEHPITAGMPQAWMHSRDELYQNLRGPTQNIHVLATAFADPDNRGTGHHEPMIFTIDYGEGRCFHTPMGHDVYSLECVGFITTFQRGCQWAATGEVTIPVPDDFPTVDEVIKRTWSEEAPSE